VVRFTGDCDISDRNAVRAIFQAVADRPRVIASFDGVEIVDSTTIGELLRAHTRAAELGGALVIVTTSPRMTRLLSIAGVTASVAIAASVEDARTLLLR
jgi:anti-anti-sigma factor